LAVDFRDTCPAIIPGDGARSNRAPKLFCGLGLTPAPLSRERFRSLAQSVVLRRRGNPVAFGDEANMNRPASLAGSVENDPNQT
jgi:hypothetical protein